MTDKDTAALLALLTSIEHSQRKQQLALEAIADALTDLVSRLGVE